MSGKSKEKILQAAKGPFIVIGVVPRPRCSSFFFGVIFALPAHSATIKESVLKEVDIRGYVHEKRDT